MLHKFSRFYDGCCSHDGRVAFCRV